MRIDVSAIDPRSPLHARIQAALQRDATARVARSSPQTTDPPGAGDQRRGNVCQTAPGQAPEVWHREDDLHRAIVALIDREARPGALAFHAANGGKRSISEARKFKGLGVVPGVPDIVVLCDGRAFGLEVKTDKGVLSAAQKQMRERFVRAGCEYEVVRSVTRARQILRRWGVIENLENAA